MMLSFGLPSSNVYTSSLTLFSFRSRKVALMVCSGFWAGFNFRIAFVLVAGLLLFPFFPEFGIALSWSRDHSYFVQKVLFSLD
jgi:hypothetical protein